MIFKEHGVSASGFLGSSGIRKTKFSIAQVFSNSGDIKPWISQEIRDFAKFFVAWRVWVSVGVFGNFFLL